MISDRLDFVFFSFITRRPKFPTPENIVIS